MNDDQIFFGHLIVAVILLFSIYGQNLMGLWAGVNHLGYYLFADALPLLPWSILFVSSSLLVNRGQDRPVYFACSIGFLILFLGFVDSFFVNKMILNHGQIQWAFTDLLYQYGSRVFGLFGIRLILVLGHCLH